MNPNKVIGIGACLVFILFLVVILSGCATTGDFGDPSYQGLSHQPPAQPNDCWVLGRDDTWRRCA